MKTITSQYWFYYTILLVIGLLSVAGINYTIDPAHLFSGDEYEKGIANLLLSGNNITNIANYDERNMKKLYISGLSQSKDVIVLGSSRSMQLRSTLFPGKLFFNNSVSGASVEDYLAIYELYNQRGYIPSIIVMGLDPWVLNKNNGQNRWISLEEEYLEIAEKLSLSATPGDLPENISRPELKELFSLPYIKESINVMFSQRGKYYPTKESDCKFASILSDGSYVYDSAFRNMSIEQVEASAIAYARQKPVYSLGGFTELDKGLQDTLTAFIEYLQKNGIKVIFYLPPYHPSTYRILSQSSEYGIIVNAEECFRDIANTHGIQVTGGYNPEDSHSQPQDFYDGMHPKDSSVRKSFENID